MVKPVPSMSRMLEAISYSPRGIVRTGLVDHYVENMETAFRSPNPVLDMYMDSLRFRVKQDNPTNTPEMDVDAVTQGRTGQTFVSFKEAIISAQDIVIMRAAAELRAKAEEELRLAREQLVREREAMNGSPATA